ncbi:hypothetical protein GCM10010923_07910 [Blastomonas marina]|uniref:Uncharacterized protein n=1 Tax=Blastomonas marina TaxID=1867408 RepID=A0ABQ1F7P4_9SPHN|nr:hypothetical protein GCM10010923_07910 [Blastomonas marina]
MSFVIEASRDLSSVSSRGAAELVAQALTRSAAAANLKKLDINRTPLTFATIHPPAW